MTYECKYCGKEVTESRVDVYVLRLGLCEHCYYTKRELQDVEASLNELCCNEVLDENDIKLMEKARVDIVAVLEKFFKVTEKL